MVIYQDDQRTISRSPHTLEIKSKRGDKSVTLRAIIREPVAEELKALRQAGYDPTGWYALAVPVHNDRRLGKIGGGGLALCPPETKAVVAEALAEYNREIQAARNRPENKERSRIEDLKREARVAYEDGEWEQYHLILAEVETAEKAFAAAFPAIAAGMRRQALLDQAEEQDSLAAGALVYDCDGSFTPEYQEQRAAEFRARAAAFRQQAEAVDV